MSTIEMKKKYTNLEKLFNKSKSKIKYRDILYCCIEIGLSDNEMRNKREEVCGQTYGDDTSK